MPDKEEVETVVVTPKPANNELDAATTRIAALESFRESLKADYSRLQERNVQLQIKNEELLWQTQKLESNRKAEESARREWQLRSWRTFGRVVLFCFGLIDAVWAPLWLLGWTAPTVVDKVQLVRLALILGFHILLVATLIWGFVAISREQE